MDEQTAKPQSQAIAALTYLLGFVTGIIFLYVEPYDKDDFVRFHARQSIAFSIAWFAVNIILSVFIAILPHAIGALLSFLLYVINLAAALLWVFLMYKAFTGERYRIPELADRVDSMGF
jgi:uncharacterized membrane protein